MLNIFLTESGHKIPSLTEEQMREIDRIAVDDYGLNLLQMMENAGRHLASLTSKSIKYNKSSIISIFSGKGNNGGGGICCARHLNNWGYKTKLFLSADIDDYKGSAKEQINILINSGYIFQSLENADVEISNSDVLIDALIGYGLNGSPYGIIKGLIQSINSSKKLIISLDIPSGVDSSNGNTPGEFVTADKTLTLALPKNGLINKVCGEIYLCDIGIPLKAYQNIGLKVNSLFDDQDLILITYENHIKNHNH